jgi:integrase
MSRATNGQGSVWLRADGRWSGAAYVRTHTGRTERRYVYGEVGARCHRQARKAPRGQ